MGADQDVVHDAEIAKHATELERARDTFGGQPLRRETRDVLTFEANRPGVRQVKPGHQIEQRRLAGPVRADDADQFAFGEIEIDGVDGGEAAETPRQTAQGQHGRAHHIVPNRPCGLNRTSSSSTMP